MGRPDRKPVRYIQRIITSERRASSSTRTVSSIKLSADEIVPGRMEIDNHADTTVLGHNCIVMSYTCRECDIAPYSDEYDALKSIPVVTGATAWTHPATGETIILIIHEALWFGDRLDHSLINPNQLRHFGLDVEDNPYRSGMGIRFDDELDGIPFTSEGATILFDTRTPTSDELETCRHVQLTSQHPWDPRDVCFPGGRKRRADGENFGLSQTTVDSTVTVAAIRRKQETDERCGMGSEAGVKGTVYDQDEFAARLIASVNVSAADVDPAKMEDLPASRSFYSKERKTSVDPRDLSEKWGISLSKAMRTLKVTADRQVGTHTGREALQGRQDVRAAKDQSHHVFGHLRRSLQVPGG